MIKYRNEVYEDYFIDENTAIITDKFGNIIEQKIHQGRPYVMINGIRLAVHCVQAHTKWGWNPTLVVHHDDKNPKNNALKNLLYITPEEHAKIHKDDMLKGDYFQNLKEIMKHNTYALGKHWKLSVESIAKSAASRTGLKRSPETKAKLSKAMKEAWKKRKAKIA